MGNCVSSAGWRGCFWRLEVGRRTDGSIVACVEREFSLTVQLQLPTAEAYEQERYMTFSVGVQHEKPDLRYCSHRNERKKHQERTPLRFDVRLAVLRPLHSSDSSYCVPPAPDHLPQLIT